MDVLSIIVMLLAATAFLALSETALISARRTRLAERKSEGNKGAAKALEVAGRSDRMVATIEICVTLISIVLGACTQSFLTPRLMALSNVFPVLTSLHEHTVSIGIVVVLTFVTLLVQIVPKRVALGSPESIASTISFPMDFLMKILKPAVLIVTATADFILRFVPHSTRTDPPITDAELLMLVRQGTKAGVFDQLEHDMLEAILELGSTKLSTLMRPRTEMEWLEVNDDMSSLLTKIGDSKLWELPVAEETADNILGVIDVREILKAAAAGQQISLRKVMRTPLFVPDTEDALFMLRTFRHTGHFIAILLDEFGGVTGVVSVRDVVEEIVGDIDRTDEEFIKRTAGQDDVWEVDGLTPVDEFAEAFGVEEPPPETTTYATVAGLVISELGHLPQKGEQLEWQGLKMQVESLQGHRISKLRVSKAA
ncbi:MAG TPA: hemolysin family protein [Candidatus Obscuribacterales bacterium]